jgi:methylglutaconyl-CoA hydratase
MAGDRLLRTSYDAGVAHLTLDSPDNRNALSSAMIDQLLESLSVAATDDTVRAVLLDHTGTVFCSGVDLRETAAGGLPVSRLGEVLVAVWECPKPVVARIGGAVRAGGLGLVTAADIAVSSIEATFAVTEVRLGLVPAVISATVLRRVGQRAAAELYLTADPVDGRRAAAIGLVTTAVPEAELDATVQRYLASLRVAAPGALAATKRLLHRADATDMREPDLRGALTGLTDLSVRHFTSDEGKEGVRAFRERRAPSWVPSV